MAPHLYCVAFLLLVGCVGTQAQRLATVLEHVDPFIGTGGNGFGIGSNLPGPQRPFGMARVSPDTVAIDNLFIPFNHFGGYYYPDEYIRVFSHTHMVGAGALDLGTVGVMPTNKFPTPLTIQSYNYRSKFSHTNETASAGYYKVSLIDSFITVELTATEHAAVHRYTFGDVASPRVILFPISHTLDAGAAQAASIQVNVEKREVSGSVLDMGGMTGRFGGYTTYFVAKFNQPLANWGTWNGNAITWSGNSANATRTSDSIMNLGAYVGWSAASGVNSVEFTVGLSSISVDQARLNIDLEVGSKDFNAVLSETQAIWEAQLSRIQVVDPIYKEDVVKFYSAAYHTLCSPTLFSEPQRSGVPQYLGFDRKTHDVAAGQKGYFTDMSIWDVHRTQFPWLVLYQPQVMQDVVSSLLQMYQQGGSLPRWPFLNGYTSAMIGTHGIVVIADAYLKGLKAFNTTLAYEAMVQAATKPQPFAGRSDLQDYLTKGYVASDISTRGCSETLEYAYDDWALGNFAAALGKNADADVFYSRSKNYKNVWYNPEKHMCARLRDGTWNCPPTWLNVFDERYVEGDGRWFVPHDASGLIELFGSTHDFNVQLEEFFEYSKLDPYNILPNPFYWAGNEPDIFAPYLFSFSGRPDLTQKWTRWLLKNKYSILPDGIPGNDDYGTMSAWVIWSSIGLYPLAGSPTYILTSPVFGKVTLQPPSTNVPLTIVAYNNSAENKYVQRARINGREIDVKNTPFVNHNELLQPQATLEFWMAATPAL